jgi:hypothetical protein
MCNSGLEIQEYGRRDPLRWPRNTLYPQKLTLTSLTSSVSSVGTVKQSFSKGLNSLYEKFSIIFLWSF